MALRMLRSAAEACLSDLAALLLPPARWFDRDISFDAATTTLMTLRRRR
jgi:hypothetical protein